MILKARNEWYVDVKNSIFTGDKQSDIMAAQKAGVKLFRFKGGNLLDFIKKYLGIYS